MVLVGCGSWEGRGGTFGDGVAHGEVRCREEGRRAGIVKVMIVVCI